VVSGDGGRGSGGHLHGEGLLDATRLRFDDERAVANTGVLRPVVLASRLGSGALVDRGADAEASNGPELMLCASLASLAELA
jgi:hypothetical protein